MKTIVKSLSIAIFCCICLSSCAFETYTTTQDDIYTESSVDIVQSNVDYNLVIRFGTPYYYNGSILYYLYEGLYYYPYYYNNYWYFRVYRHPFSHLGYRPYFRPHRYDYRFYRDYHHPRGWYRDSRYHHNGNHNGNTHGRTYDRPHHNDRGGTINRPNRPQNSNRTLNRGGSRSFSSPSNHQPSRGGSYNRGGSRTFGRPSSMNHNSSISKPSRQAPQEFASRGSTRPRF